MRIAALVSCLIIAGPATSVVRGQSQRTADEPPPLMRFVPTSAAVCLYIPNIEEMDRSLQAAKAESLIPILAGKAGTDDPGALGFELIAAVRSFIGSSSAIEPEELSQCAMAVVADAWSQEAGAVLLLHTGKANPVQRWFPKEQRTREHKTKQLRSFRTGDGLIVMGHDHTVALARANTSLELLRQTQTLMMRSSRANLADSNEYRELIRKLPPRPQAILFVGSRESGDETTNHHWAILPEWRQLAVGCYAVDDRLELALRANMAEPSEPASLDDRALAQLMQLPHTTLLAWATTGDIRTALDATVGPPAGPLARALATLRVFVNANRLRPETLAGIGPNVIVAWDQDLSGGGYTPQVAVFVQARDAEALRLEMERMAQEILRVVTALDPSESTAGPNLFRTSYFGTSITEIRLGDYAANSRFPLARLFSEVTPSFAAINGWVVFALSPEHIHNIIQAGNGLSPTLAKSPDVSRFAANTRGSSTVFIAQPALCAWVLNLWLRDLEAGKDSLLDRRWWQSHEPGEAPGRRFGIGMRARQVPGVVHVARVYEGTAAAGKLEPGDRILGVDGRLLELAEPNASLRRLLEQSRGNAGPVLRVARGEELIDVQIEIEPLPVPPELPVDPADAARELAMAGRSLQFTSLTVESAGGADFAARLTLRFIAPRPDRKAD